MSNREFLTIFSNEASDNLDVLENGLEGVLTSSDPDSINALFRAAHNIKGSANDPQVDRVGQVAHILEDLLMRWREGRLAPDRIQVDWALHTVGVLRALLDDCLSGGEDGNEEGASGAETNAQNQSLRVPMTRLDSLLSLVGEMVAARGRLHSEIGRLPATDARRVSDLYDDAESLYTDLRDQVMGLRLVPVNPLFRRLKQTALTVARQLGKEAEVICDHGELEIDASLLEGLKDPLTHMVRNAMDHGIESDVNSRLALGKARAGTMTLVARQQGNSVIFSVSDDGGGIDRQRLLAKAHSRGIEVPDDMDPANLVFEPALSTAEAVTAISGRGVGMDVVKKNVEKLRGTVEVESEVGIGSVFTATVPMTLAIMNGFFVRVGNQTYALPNEVVTECFEVPSVGQEVSSTTLLVEHMNAQVPCVHLRNHFGKTPMRDVERPVVALVEHGDYRVGLVVDEIYGAAQTVLRPLGPFFQEIRGVSGATILGDGDVGLILDIGELLATIQSKLTQSQQTAGATHV